MLIQTTLSPHDAFDASRLRRRLIELAHADEASVTGLRLVSRSVDARQRNIKVNVKAQVYVNEPMPDVAYEAPRYRDVHGVRHSVIIVGSGPAGLFAALHLLENGVKPIVLERGNDVTERKRDIAALCRNIELNSDSNYCFGEGGAGTFSDGKLYTRSNKRGDISRVLQIFHHHGAADNILYEAHPHIGSDKLPAIVKHIRQTIIDCGGEFHSKTRVTDIIIREQRAVGCVTAQGGEYIADAVVLATGHSAHDIYRMLINHHMPLEAKGFALGVRVEHPQELIDNIQYRQQRGILPAAAYQLVTQVQGRGVYSFCMCPGGHIVPATTDASLCVVNGMSASHRNSPYANSGIVVEVRVEDIPQHYASRGALAGLYYQRDVERMARRAAEQGNTFAAPAQRLADFCHGKISASLPSCSFVPGLVSSPIHQWLPQPVGQRLQQAFRDFDDKRHGFLTNEAVVLAVESRSSSPVRIPRDTQSMEYLGCKGLYPAGEGAGYAGGITSSAMDGINVAQKIVEQL